MEIFGSTFDDSVFGETKDKVSVNLLPYKAKFCESQVRLSPVEYIHAPHKLNDIWSVNTKQLISVVILKIGPHMQQTKRIDSVVDFLFRVKYFGYTGYFLKLLPTDMNANMNLSPLPLIHKLFQKYQCKFVFISPVVLSELSSWDRRLVGKAEGL